MPMFHINNDITHMTDLSFQKCLNHNHRNASARCPECGGFFCYECIAEHDDRVLCSACLSRLLKNSGDRQSKLKSLYISGQFIIGLFLLWYFFFYAAKALISIPTSYHDGTIWQSEGDK